MKRSLRSWLWRIPLDQEVDEELAFHIEMRTRELTDRGMDPTAARELDDMLGRIRSARHVSSPTVRCPKCGSTGPGAEPHVGVRATILALARFGVAARGPARALEKSWSAYQKGTGLDLYGHAAKPEPAGLLRCKHADERRTENRPDSADHPDGIAPE